MKKKLVFLAPIVLILLAVMQQQTPNSNAHSTIAISRGEGAITINLPEDMTNAPPIDEIILQAMPLSSSDSTPANCMWNLKDSIFATVDSAGPIYYGKPGTTPIPNYYDVSFSADDLSNVAGYDDDKKPCNNKDTCISDDKKALYYKVFSPLHNYAAKKLPGIIICHAGGFSDCSNYKYLSTMCIEFAKRGFVVYCVEYRRGRIKDEKDHGKYTSIQQMLAIGRAFQDGRGAIRSIIKRQRNILSHPYPYQIDTNYMFVAGHSAGATIANSLAYYTDQAMIDSIFPVPPGETPISAAIGNMDQDFYFGGPGIEYHSKIKGLWSMWGGFPMPTIGNTTVDEYKFLTRGYDTSVKLVPMIGFMGTKDVVFPYDSAHQLVYYPPKSHGKYVKETGCILNDSIKIYKNPNNTPNLRIECTNDIFSILKNNGIATLQYLDTTMGHGLTRPDSLGICPSDFGVAGSLTTNQVNEYLASRACFFFQYIISNNPTMLGGVKKFINCEDFRHSPDAKGNCETKADNDGCN